MLTNLLLALMDGQVAEVFRSPFIVPVAGCAMIGSIAVARIWSGVRTREIHSHERLARIAQGLPPEPEWEQEPMRQAVSPESTVAAPKPHGRPSDGAGSQRAGLILCSLGLGLIVFFAFLAIVLRERDVFSGAAAGIIPLAIGFGFLFDARTRRQAYDRWMQDVRLGVPSYPVPAMEAPAPPPPPPPAHLTPAQASDWRPLH